MPNDIEPSAGVARDYPLSIERVGENNVLMADGVETMYRWNGLRSEIETAGIVAPTTAPTFSTTGSGGLTIASPGALAYVVYIDNDGNVSNPSPATTRITGSTFSLLTYNAIPVSSDAKVTTKKVYRTVVGSDSVAYLENTIDNSATTLATNWTEAQLITREALVLLDSDGESPANKNAPPPNHKAALAVHLGRTFATVEVNYTRGNVQVTNGSSTVTGIDTRWTSAMEGRSLYVSGASTVYTLASISAVDANGRQTATIQRSGIAAVWSGSTNKFAKYAVRSSPTYRRTVHYSEAAKPESWPPVNLITVQETGDDITGLISHQSFLYIIERSHIHRLTYQNDPVTDGAVFLLANRGCINNRCWVVVEDQILMLDEQGIHSYDGGRTGQQISTPIQEVFRRGLDGYRINWLPSRFFHAAHYPKQEIVRWFVSMTGTYLPRHAIAYHYRLNRWWIEEYNRPIGCSTLATFGQQRLLAASSRLEVFALDEGTLDGPGESGDVLLATSDADIMSVTYVTGSLPTGVVGSLVCIISGRGKGQTREIVDHDVSGKKLWVRTAWMEMPDTTSRLLVGGIPWQWRSGFVEWPVMEQDQPRKIELTFTPTESECTMLASVYADFSLEPKEMSIDRVDEGEGISYESGDTEFRINLERAVGRAEQRLDDGRSFHTAGERLISVDLHGFGTRAKPEIHEIAIGGAQPPGG